MEAMSMVTIRWPEEGESWQEAFCGQVQRGGSQDRPGEGVGTDLPLLQASPCSPWASLSHLAMPLGRPGMAGELEQEGSLGTPPHEMFLLPPLPKDEGLISSQEPRGPSISPQRHEWSRKQEWPNHPRAHRLALCESNALGDMRGHCPPVTFRQP